MRSTRDIVASATADVESAFEEMASAEIQEVEEGTKVRSVYMGTVFALLPSGKYYMPFACSNVEVCTRCRGTCNVPNPFSDPFLTETLSKWRGRFVEKWGFTTGEDSRWHRAHKRLSHLVNKLQGLTCDNINCPIYHGVGSREDYEDGVWMETAEEVASSLGCSIESGESDPCDLFLTQVLTDEEEGKEETR